jgi:hypothetical protein
MSRAERVRRCDVPQVECLPSGEGVHFGEQRGEWFPGAGREALRGELLDLPDFSFQLTIRVGRFPYQALNSPRRPGAEHLSAEMRGEAGCAGKWSRCRPGPAGTWLFSYPGNNQGV